jgi:hypothetical protein
MHCFSKIQNCDKWRVVWRIPNALKCSLQGTKSIDETTHREQEGKGSCFCGGAIRDGATLVIDKCLTEVTSGKAAKEHKISDTMWAVMIENQDFNIELEKEQYAVRMREYFVIMTADASNMDQEKKE